MGFPIMIDGRLRSRDEQSRQTIRHIPWSLIEPHEAQAEKNHSQSLRRLAERGGLSPTEAVAVLEDRRWTLIPFEQAHARLAELVASAPRAQ